MLYAGLIVTLQILCLVHCIKRHRHKGWILLVLFAPLIGSLVYLWSEVWPEHQRRKNYDNANPLRYRSATPQPAVALKVLQNEVNAVNTAQNRENLADEYLRQGLYGEAVSAYQDCLDQQENEPNLLCKLAEAAYGHQNYAQALEALHRIRALSDYRPAKVRLLLARSYEASGQPEKAQVAYEQAIKAHTELEIKCRYALFLQSLNQAKQTELALDLFKQVIQIGQSMPEHTRRQNRVWIDLATRQTTGPSTASDNEREFAHSEEPV
jgi:hypothetical protein